MTFLVHLALVGLEQIERRHHALEATGIAADDRERAHAVFGHPIRRGAERFMGVGDDDVAPEVVGRTRARADTADPLALRIVDAAGAARDAAARVAVEYDSCGACTLGLRFARIAMRASCHAGFAVLELLPSDNAPG